MPRYSVAYIYIYCSSNFVVGWIGWPLNVGKGWISNRSTVAWNSNFNLHGQVARCSGHVSALLRESLEPSHSGLEVRAKAGSASQVHASQTHYQPPLTNEWRAKFESENTSILQDGHLYSGHTALVPRRQRWHWTVNGAWTCCPRYHWIDVMARILRQHLEKILMMHLGCKQEIAAGIDFQLRNCSATRLRALERDLIQRG